MIKTIHVLPKELYTGRVYLWNINGSSLYLLEKLFLYGIIVEGFVVDFEIDQNELLGKRIFSVDEFLNEIDDKKLLLTNEFEVVDEKIECIRICENTFNKLTELNGDLFKKNVYIYGAGHNGRKIYDELVDSGINVSGFIVSECEGSNSIYGIPVEKFDEKKLHKNDAIIVGTEIRKYTMEILEKLSNVDCDIYHDQIVYDGNIKETNMPFVLNKARLEKRKIVYCGTSGNIKKIIDAFCMNYDITIDECLYSEDKDFDNKLYSLAYDEINNITFFVNEIFGEKKWRILKVLFELGVELGEMNITGLTECTLSEPYLKGKIFEVPDLLFVSHVSLTYYDKMVGWRVLPSRVQNKNVCKIAILGGSTSTDEIYQPESWGRKLWKKLNNAGINATVYVGAVWGDDVLNELLRFLRDGESIDPDIVISMSGVNDIELVKGNRFNFREALRKYEHTKEKYYSGIDNGETAYEYWLRIEKKIQLIVNSIGARYYSFLQPMNIAMRNMDSYEKQQFELDDKGSAMDFIEKSNDEEFYHNLIELFHHKEGCFIDCCHYSDKANEIIADKVFEVIYGEL